MHKIHAEKITMQYLNMTVNILIHQYIGDPVSGTRLGCHVNERAGKAGHVTRYFYLYSCILKSLTQP